MRARARSGVARLIVARQHVAEHLSHVHPLARYHAVARGCDAHRISDSVPFAEFRRVGLDQAIALPVHLDDSLLVGFVPNRTRRDFSDRDRALLELVRGSLANRYRQAVHRRPPQWPALADPAAAIAFALGVETRTAAVMRALAASRAVPAGD